MRYLRRIVFLVVSMCVTSIAQQHGAPVHPRITTITLDPDDVAVLRLRPGYVTSVFLPEEINAIVLGDPSSFRAEHSESEPRLVTVKPVTERPAETNMLVTAKSGREVSLHLVSEGRTNAAADVDFVLQYEQPASAMIPAAVPTLMIPDTKELEPASEKERGGVIGPA